MPELSRQFSVIQGEGLGGMPSQPRAAPRLARPGEQPISPEESAAFTAVHSSYDPDGFAPAMRSHLKATHRVATAGWEDDDHLEGLHNSDHEVGSAYSEHSHDPSDEDYHY